mgnify:CR=1 FL=1|tara:strand:+ start:602 stop:853 length:252 start_codon:yes stop_codon:yes gene_type:complete
MNNGNQPINVVRGANNVPFDNDGFLESSGMVTGLTKREHFAGLAMQGWLARCANVPHSVTLKPCDMAAVSVTMADALLAELDK